MPDAGQPGRYGHPKIFGVLLGQKSIDPLYPRLQLWTDTFFPLTECQTVGRYPDLLHAALQRVGPGLVTYPTHCQKGREEKDKEK